MKERFQASFDISTASEKKVGLSLVLTGMKRAITFLFIAGTSAAIAQTIPFEFGVGYAQSASFEKSSGGRGTLTGPEFTLSQSLLNVPLFGAATVGASMFMGGTLSSGSDADGTIYRVFVRGKTTSVGSRSLYGITGAYYAFGSGRGGSFGNVSGVGFDFGVGMPLGFGGNLPGIPKASAEFIMHQGSRAQTRGWSIGLNFRL